MVFKNKLGRQLKRDDLADSAVLSFIYTQEKLDGLLSIYHMVAIPSYLRILDYIQGYAERIRRITTFVVLLQVIWAIPNQVFTVYSLLKLFTIINILPIGNYIWDLTKLFKRVLQMVLHLILSPYPCMN